MFKYFSLLLFVAISAAAISPAHARGGWDGNGRSVNGIDQSALGSNGVTQQVIQVNRCAATTGKNESQLRYVEFPAGIGDEHQSRLDVALNCVSGD